MYEFLPNIDTKKTGIILKRLRESKNMTQQQVADYFGYSCVAISKWESGKSVPKVENLLALRMLYGISIDEILQVEGREHDRGEDERSSPVFFINYQLIETPYL